jgi:stearoyl-CoA desaturase (delta-9 desaturase)
VTADTAVPVTPVDLDDEVGVGVDAVDSTKLDVATIRERTSFISRLVTVVAVVAPVFGILSAAGVLWGVALRPLDLYLFAGFYLATGLGITVGYHRLFTHRSFSTSQPIRIAFAILGAMTLQGPVTQWVTDHRKHHARSDAPGDPHSPHLSGPGVAGALRGFVHSHIGWLFSTKGMERGVIYGRDLFEDRPIRIVDRCYLLWVALSVGLPFLFAYAITGSVARGVEALVWAGLIRIFCFQHATFAVNSVCHLFGARPYATGDRSTNNVVVAVLTFGEGWHNNHHAFPRSARHGLERRQLDVSYLVIKGLRLVHLAEEIKLPTPLQRSRVAVTA